MFKGVSRREILMSSAATAFLALAGCSERRAGEFSGPRLAEYRAGAAPLPLRAEVTQATFRRGDAPSTLFTYGPRFGPVLRATKDEALTIDFANALDGRHTSVHWHGMRIANAMDGVPYVTQQPVQPGEHFRYSFVPPDAGSYFFHPHCETVTQLGRGLAGVLIVDGDAAEPFDDDLVLVLKDWRLGDDGTFLPLLTVEGAGKAGTFGTLRTVNGAPGPHFEVPASANIRIRIINVDNTRIPNLGVLGAQAAIIAHEGNAVPPHALDTIKIGPAMRVDLCVRTPLRGEQFQLVDYFAPEPVVLATFEAMGAARRTGAFVPAPLISNALPEPDLDHALRLNWTLSAASSPSVAGIPINSDETFRYADDLCLAPRTFWTIDGRTWPERGHEALPPPLAEFPLGASVIIEFFNGTPHTHPMHLHGHTFKVISASRARTQPYWTDTVLVTPKERVQIAFVADNPGDWMVHCHIIEHQDTGMMGWFRVA